MRTSTNAIAWTIATALTVATTGTASAPALAQRVAAAPANVIDLSTGRGRLVTLPRPMSDLFVADDKIADVQVRSPTQLYIFGKGAGETTVYATSKSGATVFSSTVRVGTNLDSVGQMLRMAMPDAKIVATPLNGVVLLTGTVANPEDAAEAERLTQAFVGDTTKILSRLKTATPLQVNLQVKFVEVNKSYIKSVGINLATLDATGGFKFGISQGGTGFNIPQYTPGGPLATGFTTGGTGVTLLPPGAGNHRLGLAGHLLGLDILSAIDLGETNGQVTQLANPNLTALSGETGTFLAGGEIPIPLSQGLGAVSVDYKQYGVSLAYTPTVLADGRISLRVRPEVSQLDYSNAVSLGGTRIPALTTRRAETTLELGSGQSMVIGGLLQNTHSNNIDKAPFLGDLPIIGALFRSNSFQRNETELVIVITPYLVNPVNANQVAYPSDGYQAPTDAGRLLLGTLNESVTGGDRPKPSVAPSGSYTPAIGAAAAVPASPTPDRKNAKFDADRRKNAAPGFSF